MFSGRVPSTSDNSATAVEDGWQFEGGKLNIDYFNQVGCALGTSRLSLEESQYSRSLSGVPGLLMLGCLGWPKIQSR